VIDLSYGGSFSVDALIKHIENSGRDFIIIGQQKRMLSEHTKKQSLDFWLREHAHNPNQKQAENKVISALLATKMFDLSRNLKCPETGRMCRGLILRKDGRAAT